MSKYRIVKLEDTIGTKYIAQKRSLIGVWYNFNNVNALQDGIYGSEKRAMEKIKIHRRKTTVTIIDV